MSPHDPADPDPFAETPLSDSERSEMLQKLTDYMRPRVADLDDQARDGIRALWDELRDQTTVESFEARAEALLDALEEPALASAAAQPIAGPETGTNLPAADAPPPTSGPTGRAAGMAGGEERDSTAHAGASPAAAAAPRQTAATAGAPAPNGGDKVVVIARVSAVVVAIGAVVAIVLVASSGSDSGGSATAADAVEAPIYRPSSRLTQEIRTAGLNPGKFRQACLAQNYERVKWFQDRIPVRITCRYHAAVDLDTGSPAKPGGPRYEVARPNRDTLWSEFGLRPSELRPVCLKIAREYCASSLRGDADSDTYWSISDRHHGSAVVSYTANNNVFSGSRRDPCVRFADVDPWYGAAPYFVANGTARNDTDGLEYDWQ